MRVSRPCAWHFDWPQALSVSRLFSAATLSARESKFITVCLQLKTKMIVRLQVARLKASPYHIRRILHPMACRSGNSRTTAYVAK